MWSKLFIDFPTRPLKASDDADIKLISAYLPYVDVLATDTFMATLIRNLKLDAEYNTTVFGANKQGLLDFERHLTDYLPQAKPARWPELSIFVRSDSAIKEESWEFFRALGNHARSCERDGSGWVELFAFDDGAMPQYFDPRFGSAPYHGLQDVTNIPLPPGATPDDLIRLCRQQSRAHKFVLIDTRIDFPPGFMREILDACRSGRGKAVGLTIHEAATT